MSDSNYLEVGDLVELKSGGPVMTVQCFTAAALRKKVL
jgi:uncharacterized protein YodC (DUF2158 family)